MEKRAPRITQSYEPVFVLRRPASGISTGANIDRGREL